MKSGLFTLKTNSHSSWFFPNTFQLAKMSRLYFLNSILLVLITLFLGGCSQEKKTPIIVAKPEKITRSSRERSLEIPPQKQLEKISYPWEEGDQTTFPKLTKEYFRCKGSSLNPVHIVNQGKEEIRYYDCGGSQRHSLPLRDNQEFIYPLLLDLLNDIQRRSEKRVVVTCGHCCPDHNAYINPSISNQSSKHLIGAEVDFYLQGLEWEPEKVIEMIFLYYKEQPKYKNLKEFQEFKRVENGKTTVSTPPWYNKEIFIKLVKKAEGRDFDNRHPYPYITIQVRYDWDAQEAVTYSWDKAFRNFHRW